MLTVFAVMLLTMLLGMVMNAGRHVDGKIRMQNAADAVAYSGAAALVRGMNSLAFTNHLLSEVFAMNAWLEEARDQRAKTYVPRILQAWRRVGEALQSSKSSKLQRLGLAIVQKVPLEQQVVDAFSAWAEAVSGLMLPVMKEVLDRELIPEYQRAVVKFWPDVAWAAAAEVALRHGRPELGRGPMRAELLWADLAPVVGGESLHRSLPVVDPSAIIERGAEAREERAMFARWYLELWNNDTLRFFRSGASREYGGSARLSMFFPLWRTFTCGRLDDVLARYHDTNLPMVIEENLGPPVTDGGDFVAANKNVQLENNYVVVGVVRWSPLPEMMPRLFASPVPSDPVAFAEAHYFVPQRRQKWRKITLGTETPSTGSGIPGFGGVPGEILDPPDQGTANPGPGGSIPSAGGTPDVQWVTVTEDRDGLPGDAIHWLPYFREHGMVANRDSWTLFNQNWMARLVPAWQPKIADLPNTGSLNSKQLHTISLH